MGRTIGRPAATVLLLAAFAAPAAGQGFSVYNQSACSSARGGAVAAAPCPDASSIYFSPAALAFQPSTFSLGATVVHNSGAFTYDQSGQTVDRKAANPVVPQAYLSYRFGPEGRLAAGIGVWAPFGLTLKWPETFEGRFLSWNTSVTGIYVQPTLAWQIVPGKFSVAAGPQIVFGGMEINQHQDAYYLGAPAYPFRPLPEIVPGTDIVSANMKGTGTGYGFQVGAFWMASDQLSFGARYMHQVKVDLSGDATFQPLNQDLLVTVAPGVRVPFGAVIANQAPYLFAPGGPFSDQGVEATITFPAEAVVGVNLKVTPELALEGDFQWNRWSVFDTVTAKFESGTELELAMDYEDTQTYRAGFTYTAAQNLDLMGGFSYNGPAAPAQTVTPLLPDAARQIYGLGFVYSFGALRAEAYYNYVNQEDRAGRVRNPEPGTNPLTLNIGTYSNQASLFGLTLAYVFGY